MGLFNKLKSSMNGGVKVRVEAPGSINSGQVIPVNVTVTSDSTQTISSVKAQLKVVTREEGIGFGGPQGGVGVNEERTTAQTVAEVESRESFTINAGENKTISLQLFMNGNQGAGVGSMFGQNAGGKLGGLLQTVATAAQSMDRVNYIYSVHAYVDVQGHNLNPSDQQPIQIIPAAAANTATQPIENFQSQGQVQPQPAITDPLQPQPEAPQPIVPVQQPVQPSEQPPEPPTPTIQ
jgi:hypothetical protein